MIFLIPARAGSKRLPGKNKRLFCGLPLWMWSWATAERVKGLDDGVIVSTDDTDIHTDWRGIMRPAHLCGDDVPMKAVIDYYFTQTTHANICLLQPTSPARPDSLVRMMLARGDSCRSVTNGKPNGQCYVYRRGMPDMVDVETEQGHDIDTIEQFNEAEKAMMERFK